jgi:hypothetical protein
VVVNADALWGSHGRSEWFARALAPDGFARNARMALGGCPRLDARSWWPVFPEGLSSLDFFAPAFLGELARLIFVSVLEEFTSALSKA